MDWFEQDKGLPGVTVEFRKESTSGELVTLSTTRADGTYSASNLPSGTVCTLYSKSYEEGKDEEAYVFHKGSLEADLGEYSNLTLEVVTGRRPQAANEPNEAYGERIAEQILRLSDNGRNQERMRSEWEAIRSSGLSIELEAIIVQNLHVAPVSEFGMMYREVPGYIRVDIDDIRELELHAEEVFTAPNGNWPRWRGPVLDDTERDIAERIIYRFDSNPEFDVHVKERAKQRLQADWRMINTPQLEQR